VATILILATTINLCPIMPMGSITARQFVGATALGVEIAPVAS
jgi:hypothetical protein